MWGNQTNCSVLQFQKEAGGADLHRPDVGPTAGELAGRSQREPRVSRRSCGIVFPISSGPDEASCSCLTPLCPWSSTVLPPAPFSFSFSSPLPLLSPPCFFSLPPCLFQTPHPHPWLCCPRWASWPGWHTARGRIAVWLLAGSLSLETQPGWELQGEPTYILEMTFAGFET